jgi:hypothetical protein
VENYLEVRNGDFLDILEISKITSNIPSPSDFEILKIAKVGRHSSAIPVIVQPR